MLAKKLKRVCGGSPEPTVLLSLLEKIQCNRNMKIRRESMKDSDWEIIYTRGIYEQNKGNKAAW